MTARLFSLVLAAMLALPHAAPAQSTIQLTRERVLDAFEYVEVHKINDNKLEVVIDAPTLVDKKWRFFLRAPNARRSVTLLDIRDGSKLAVIPLDQLKRGTWSPHLELQTVFFEIDADAGLEVQMIGFPVVSIGTQTPVGELELKPVHGLEMPFRLRQLTEAVGQLAVVEGQLGGQGTTFFTYCTAFLIAPNRALTAEHCVSRGLDDRFAQVTFGFTTEQAPLGTGRHDVAILDKSRALDLAILTISPPSTVETMFELSAREPAPETELLVFQHYGGDPLSISDDDDCLTTGDRFKGPIFLTDSGIDSLPDVAFGHGCDTTKSSSGAPVVDRETLSLVGLHQRGYGSGEQQVNRALRLNQLRAFLDIERPGPLE